MEDTSHWYQKSLDYWSQQEASVKGVLAGHHALSSVDLDGSTLFLKRLQTLPETKGGPPDFTVALDCGAGVGRVTSGCLLKFFSTVDLLEPVSKLLSCAKEQLKDQVRNYYQMSLQDLDPEPHSYDCIWIQWCALYLLDHHLEATLRRCAKGLRPKGVICVKENIAETAEHIDDSDNSIMRTIDSYVEIFDRAGLEVIAEMRQPRFPKQLCGVHMFALRPT